MAFRADFASNAYCDRLFDHFGIAIPDDVGRSVTRRKAEFLAGRICAALCLKELGSQNCQVAIGTHRSPAWPTGYVGSITHTDDHAIAVVRQRAPGSDLGIDAEGNRQSALAQTRHMFLNQNEETWLRKMPMSPDAAWATAFSAKESFFKMAYAHVGRYFDFDAVRIYDVGSCGTRLGLRVTQDLAPKIPAGTEYPVDVYSEDSLVITLLHRVDGRHEMEYECAAPPSPAMPGPPPN